MRCANVGLAARRGVAAGRCDAAGLGPRARLPANWYGCAGGEVDFRVVLFDGFV
jgi:hypothetical protein